MGIVVYFPAVAPPLARDSSGDANIRFMSPKVAADDATKKLRRDSVWSEVDCIPMEVLDGVEVLDSGDWIENPWPKAKRDERTMIGLIMIFLDAYGYVMCVCALLSL
mmetsp:Transcript_17195/g.32551  ORF Transcript_17195/g.32551 Transcript_17195/m.32551 type:complete len:107 (+) Transcript_17195:684-1004(+)